MNYSAECPNCEEWYYMSTDSAQDRLIHNCPVCGTQLVYSQDWVHINLQSTKEIKRRNSNGRK